MQKRCLLRPNHGNFSLKHARNVAYFCWAHIAEGLALGAAMGFCKCDELKRHSMRWHPNSHCRQACGNNIRYYRLFLEDQRERTRPECINELQGMRRNMLCVAKNPVCLTYMDDKGSRRGLLFASKILPQHRVKGRRRQDHRPSPRESNNISIVEEPYAFCTDESSKPFTISMAAFYAYFQGLSRISG